MQHNNKENYNSDISTVKYLEQIFIEAIKKGASDIHFEPYEKIYRIRFRIDGILYEITKINLAQAGRIGARLKIIAELNIAEKRLPQDGRFSYILDGELSYDFRLSTCPTIFGEKMVVRILKSPNINLDVDELGLETFQKKIFLNFLKKPQGMILVTGSTGSGKTITLYTLLKLLNVPERNISTVEDPVELNLFGINQVEVNYKIGLNFVAALRAFLRQDPDIIMVGEIRDLETAEIAIKAAQTGHLVICTLHTNSAVESLERLNGIGISSFNLATSISLIIAQRLVRKLCLRCRKKIIVPSEIFDNKLVPDEKVEVYEPLGCEYCRQGYRGRTAIFEFLVISKKIRSMMIDGAGIDKIATQAQSDGMLFLRENALQKVIRGITSLQEINRVLGG